MPSPEQPDKAFEERDRLWREKDNERYKECVTEVKTVIESLPDPSSLTKEEVERITPTLGMFSRVMKMALTTQDTRDHDI